MNCDEDVTVTHAVLYEAQIQEEKQHHNHGKDINQSHIHALSLWNSVSPTQLLLNEPQENASILLFLSVHVSIKWIQTN